MATITVNKTAKSSSNLRISPLSRDDMNIPNSPSRKLTKLNLTNVTHSQSKIGSEARGSCSARQRKEIDSSFATSREQMIQRYYSLADQYRQELQRRDKLREEKRAIQTEIASIFIQGDRIDELIKKVKETQQPEAD